MLFRSVYLGSSLVDYFLFFQVPEWGVYSTFPHVVLRAVRKIPTPAFTDEQTKALTEAHRDILRDEKAFRLESEDAPAGAEKQRSIDKSVFKVLNVPDDIQLLVEDCRDSVKMSSFGLDENVRLGGRRRQPLPSAWRH